MSSGRPDSHRPRRPLRNPAAVAASSNAAPIDPLTILRDEGYIDNSCTSDINKDKNGTIRRPVRLPFVNIGTFDEDDDATNSAHKMLPYGLRTVPEQDILAVLQAIRDKRDWCTKFSDPTIHAKWRQEVLSILEQEKANSEKWSTKRLVAKNPLCTLRYAFKELEWQTKHEPLAAGPDNVFASDTIVPDSVRLELADIAARLENTVPDSEKDWHPGSNDQVLDLVHPSLFPVIYGQSLAHNQPARDIRESMSMAPRTPSDPSGEPSKLEPIPAPSKDGDNYSPYDPSFLSDRYQWLPAELQVDADGRAEWMSYINNLHPEDHPTYSQFWKGHIPAESGDDPVWERVEAYAGEDQAIEESRARAARYWFSDSEDGEFYPESSSSSSDGVCWSDGEDEDQEIDGNGEDQGGDSAKEGAGAPPPPVTPLPPFFDGLSSDYTESDYSGDTECSSSDQESEEEEEEEDDDDDDKEEQDVQHDRDQHEAQSDSQLDYPSAAELLNEYALSATDDELADPSYAQPKLKNTNARYPYERYWQGNPAKSIPISVLGAPSEPSTWFQPWNEPGYKSNDAMDLIYAPNVPRSFRPPCPADIQLLAPPESQLRGRRLQVIVKLANIQLTPENPKYTGGSWHVEGMLNESIIATGLYYYAIDNITDSKLAFRSGVQPVEYYSEVDAALDAVYEMSGFGYHGFSLMQECGHITAHEGRAVAFPNMYQHQVQPFELVDKTRPGYRKLVAFFLVDPQVKVHSSATVPPQQADWFLRELAKEGHPQHGVVDKLPNEIVDQIVGRVGSLTSMAKAKEERLKLMEERSRMVKHSNEVTFEVGFNLCEH